ncbi:anti-sigma factor family protein [Streptomyces sp. NPDC086787]|uniref:anti-sigma factor family protein n=1 Tax=Streptomyces sp. NPDC086787 TaxID=3365759 RepID=UPI0038196A70
MSGSRPKPAEALLAEQHLGDRLSALVDGELDHESRERVLAHLATCVRCKTEADAQRRLKNVFAQAAPPPPSESFLARLQSLPAGGGDADEGTGSPLGAGVFGVRGPEGFKFGYVPVRPHPAAASVADRGFRIHPVGERPSSRGLRFAAAAAGAVSLAAVALGGVSTGIPGDLTPDARGGPGTNVTPARTQGGGGTGGGTSAPDSQRRRTTGPLLVQASRLGETSVAPTSVFAPLQPGLPAPARELATADTPPLIRPLSWPTAGPAPTNATSPHRAP